MKRLSIASVLSLTLIIIGGCSRNPEPIVAPSANTNTALLLRVGSGEIITVTTLNDVSDFSGLQQVNDLPGPDKRVSFREAVTAANNTAGPQTIAFAIPVAEF